MDVLKASKSVTSVDLSSNFVGDEGASAIATVLAQGGAPELISLDLRENPLSEGGLTMLVSGQMPLVRSQRLGITHVGLGRAHPCCGPTHSLQLSNSSG